MYAFSLLIILLFCATLSVHVAERLRSSNATAVFANKRATARSDVHIIVARTNEPLDHLEWLVQYSRARLYTIYNRGETDVPSKWLSKNLLENVGREAYIYLAHIIKHYYDLADVNIFTQVMHYSTRL